MAGGTPRCITRNLNAMPINVGAVKKNYARLLNSTSFFEFGFFIEAPHFDFPQNISNFHIDQDFHTLGHGSIGGEVSWNSPTTTMFPTRPDNA